MIIDRLPIHLTVPTRNGPEAQTAINNLHEYGGTSCIGNDYSKRTAKSFKSDYSQDFISWEFAIELAWEDIESRNIISCHYSFVKKYLQKNWLPFHHDHPNHRPW